MNKHALLLLSGGQDSTVCLFDLLHAGFHVHALVVDYGQRHAREIGAAQLVAKIADVPCEVVKVPAVLRSTSPLTDPDAKLEQYASFEEMDRTIGDRLELTFVPMRNLFFLTIAANRAIANGCDFIATGVCGADAANYPDCRIEFIAHAKQAINSALGKAEALQIVAPLINRSKKDTVLLAHELGARAYAALAFSHTAYDGSYPPTGADHATVLRAKGFEDAGLPDPLIVKAAMENHIKLPDRPNYSSAMVDSVARHITDIVLSLKP